MPEEQEQEKKSLLQSRKVRVGIVGGAVMLLQPILEAQWGITVPVEFMVFVIATTLGLIAGIAGEDMRIKPAQIMAQVQRTLGAKEASQGK